MNCWALCCDENFECPIYKSDCEYEMCIQEMCDRIMDHEKRINPDYDDELCCIDNTCSSCKYNIYARIFNYFIFGSIFVYYWIKYPYVFKWEREKF